MERIIELEKAISEYRKKRLNTMQKHSPLYIDSLKPAFCKKLGNLIEDQIKRQKEDEMTKIKNIFLCRLLSSAYTDSYQVVLGFSDSSLYLDENQSQVYWSPPMLYKDLKEEMETVTSLLRKNFIRLQESELFTMKKRLMDDTWSFFEIVFRTLMQENFSQILNSSLRLEKEILIRSGNYMDKLDVIDIQEGENNEKNANNSVIE